MRPAGPADALDVEGQRQLQGVAPLHRDRAGPPRGRESRRGGSRSGCEAGARRQTAGHRRLAGFIKTDVAFHYVFAEIIRNPTFIALHDAMSTWLLQQRQIALQEPGEDKKGYEAHARIYEAVMARDPDAAEAAMRNHLEWGWVAFWRRYEDSGQLG